MKTKTARSTSKISPRTPNRRVVSVKIENRPGGGLLIHRSHDSTRYERRPGKMYMTEVRRQVADSHFLPVVALPLPDARKDETVNEKRMIDLAIAAVKGLQQQVRELHDRLDQTLAKFDNDMTRKTRA